MTGNGIRVPTIKESPAAYKDEIIRQRQQVYRVYMVVKLDHGQINNMFVHTHIGLYRVVVFAHIITLCTLLTSLYRHSLIFYLYFVKIRICKSGFFPDNLLL